jgi:hypothetical protein
VPDAATPMPTVGSSIANASTRAMALKFLRFIATSELFFVVISL